MDCEELCQKCKNTLDSEIKQWEEVKSMIIFKNGKYGGMLSEKEAANFHYPFWGEANDYLEVLSNHQRYKAQSFKWKPNHKLEEEEELEGKTIFITNPISNSYRRS